VAQPHRKKKKLLALNARKIIEKKSRLGTKGTTEGGNGMNKKKEKMGRADTNGKKRTKGLTLSQKQRGEKGRSVDSLDGKIEGPEKDQLKK